ncbi:hypothetical protein B0A55_05672 [Friedmanniomyces simplex]|uniref:Uncharacterized protein n=1 Tax=Friedmanniomyces simplex TaxID=329884 RepID=A0A4U0XMB9_9PEZI|nr:hypothetical protein B0A55_05672 [Friedmanniomyces simplex]
MAEIASVFDCHHIVTIRYPSLLEIRSHDEELALTTLLNCTTRFDPNVPLVADIGVEHNAGRQTDAETSFYSITPAVLSTPEQWAAQDLGDEVRLLHDMQLATGGNGCTELFVVTFSVPRPAKIVGDEHPDGVYTGSSPEARRGDHGDGGDEIGDCDAMIRIWRNTQLPPVEQEGGMFSIQIVHGEYMMTTAVFDAVESDALWLENIRDLVHGR